MSFFKRSESESAKAANNTSITTENPKVNGIQPQVTQDGEENKESTEVCGSKDKDENVTGIMNGGNHSVSAGASDVDMLCEEALRDLCESGDSENLFSRDTIADNLSETRLDSIGAENGCSTSVNGGNIDSCHETVSVQNNAMGNETDMDVAGTVNSQQTPKCSDSITNHTDSLINGCSNTGDKSDGGIGGGVKSLLSQFSASPSTSSSRSSSKTTSFSRSLLSSSSSLSSPSPSCKRAHSATNDFLNSLASKRSKFNSEKMQATPNKLAQPLQSDSDNDLEVVYENFAQPASCDAETNGEVKTESDDGESEERSNESSQKVIMCEEYDPNDFTENRKSRQVKFDLEAVRERVLRRDSRKDNEKMTRRRFKAKISPTDNTAAEDELKREISKDMFAEVWMETLSCLYFLL